MAKGYAGTRDAAAQSYLMECFAPKSVASAATGIELDRYDFGTKPLEHLELEVVATVALASGAANDEIDITVTITDSATSGSGHVTYKTKVFTVVVDDNSTCTFACSLPVALNGADRYINVSVDVAAGTGAPTVSSASGSAAYRVYPEGVPVAAAQLGAGLAAYDKDGYINTTITA